MNEHRYFRMEDLTCGIRTLVMSSVYNLMAKRRIVPEYILLHPEMLAQLRAESRPGEFEVDYHDRRQRMSFHGITIQVCRECTWPRVRICGETVLM